MFKQLNNDDNNLRPSFKKNEKKIKKLRSTLRYVYIWCQCAVRCVLCNKSTFTSYLSTICNEPFCYITNCAYV